MSTLLSSEKTAAPSWIPGWDEAAWAALAAHPEPAVLRQARAEAFAAYAAAPLPTQRQEAWRRTDPAAFLAAPLAAPGGVATLLGAAPPPLPWDEQFDAVATFSDEGLAVRDVSGALAGRQVVIGSLAAVAERFPERLDGAINPKLVAHRHKFDWLQRAFWQQGLYLQIPRGVTLPKGILVRYAYRQADRLQLPRLVVRAEAGSRARLVEHQTSAADGRLLVLRSTDVRLDQDARLEVLTLQEWGAQTCELREETATLAREAHLTWRSVQLGGATAKGRLSCEVAGPGAEAELDGLYFAVGTQHLDQETLQLHASPQTTSNLLYKGAVKDQAHSIYQGLIVAQPGAIRVDAYQRNNNLVLDDGAHADSLPQLEIDADDLKCSHGSTIGNLDPEHLYYLRARGLPEPAARRMLLQAFFEEIIGRVPQAFLQEYIRTQVEAKIP